MNERKEIIEMLNILYHQAKPVLMGSTLLTDIKIDSFYFVIGKAIMLLKGDSEL